MYYNLPRATDGVLNQLINWKNGEDPKIARELGARIAYWEQRNPLWPHQQIGDMIQNIDHELLSPMVQKMAEQMMKQIDSDIINGMVHGIGGSIPVVVRRGVHDEITVTVKNAP